jgi:hypothetical protein
MKENFTSWLTETLKVSGVLACCVRAPDRRTFTRSGSPQFTPVALDQACRCLADTFQIINANRFPSGLVRWVYENHYVYGSIRHDGFCLALLTHRDTPEVQANDLERIVSEFHTLAT